MKKLSKNFRIVVLCLIMIVASFESNATLVNPTSPIGGSPGISAPVTPPPSKNGTVGVTAPDIILVIIVLIFF